MPEPDDMDQVGELAFAPPPMKHSDTRDSISSIDSDISLSYDHNAEEGAHLADMSDCGSDAADNSQTAEDAEPSLPPPIVPTGVIDEAPFVPPDDDLANKIVAQVEFYFSDVNITKDAFLLKHVKRNKEGYVSLKLISSFKRVKHLARDWRVVAYALNMSTKLQINEAGTKLRRLAPLPAYDETAPSRTVVAAHLPPDRPTIEGVADLFSSFGDIALVRILRPGNPVPSDARSFLAKHPELSGVVCALVEFATTESAQKALTGWRARTHGVTVLELAAPASQHQQQRKRSTPAKKTAVSRLVESMATSDYSSSCASSSEAEPDFCRAAPTTPTRRQVGRARTAPELCPWLAQRRLSLRRDSASDSDMVFRPRSNSAVTHLPENVLRMPRGPDGSRGFARHRPSLPAVLCS